MRARANVGLSRAGIRSRAGSGLSSMMDWGWSNIPPGFISKQDRQGRLLIVRENLRDRLAIEAICADTAEITAYQGRGRLRAITLGSGERALVRSYRHGGLLGAFTGRVFFTWPPRPVRELVVTEELRRRGVPTVEPCGACVEPLWGPFYRAWFITRELIGARDLWEQFSHGFVGGFEAGAVLSAVADSVKQLHREGVYHRDLNLKNILVRGESNGFGIYIIDFDKATLFLGRLPERIARRNIERLRRSARKLDPMGRRISDADWKHFLERYYGSGNSGH